MRVEIIASGTELIRGRSIDTNTPAISRRLNQLGADVRYFSCYGDHLEDLVEGIRHALKRADLVILTGGLGPTVDDLSREAACRATGRKLAVIPEERDRLRERMPNGPAINERQAFFPKGASILHNPVGSASGFLLRVGAKRLAVLPGPPREMQATLENLLSRLGLPPAPWIDKSFRIAGISESVVEDRIYPSIQKLKDLIYGITAKGTIISINLRSHHPATVEAVRGIIRDKLGTAYFGEDDDTIASKTAELLMARRKTLALAESCTGGEIASKLTDIPGVSASLLEAMVTYSNESKMSRLGVRQSTLAKHGAVSEETAREMSEGVREKADIGAATTGIAGPAGGTADKPVGLVYMSVSTERGTKVEKKVFRGTRLDVKERASEFTLNMIRLALLNED